MQYVEKMNQKQENGDIYFDEENYEEAEKYWLAVVNCDDTAVRKQVLENLEELKETRRQKVEEV